MEGEKYKRERRREREGEEESTSISHMHAREFDQKFDWSIFTRRLAKFDQFGQFLPEDWPEV